MPILWFSGAAKDAPIVTPLMHFVRQKRAAKSGARVGYHSEPESLFFFSVRLLAIYGVFDFVLMTVYNIIMKLVFKSSLSVKKSNNLFCPQYLTEGI